MLSIFFMQIREATEDDLPALIPLQIEVQEHHRAVYPDTYPQLDPARCREEMLKFLEDPRARVLVAHESNKLLGYATLKYEEIVASALRHPDRVATVDQMTVAQSHQRQGAATALMSEIRRRALKEGCTQIRLDVLEFNEGARAFYEKCGFTTYRRRMIRKLDG